MGKRNFFFLFHTLIIRILDIFHDSSGYQVLQGIHQKRDFSKSSKRKHDYPNLPMFPQRTMLESDVQTLPASCFSLLRGKYDHQLLSVGMECCSAGVPGLFRGKPDDLSLETDFFLPGRKLSILANAEWKYNSFPWEKGRP